MPSFPPVRLPCNPRVPERSDPSQDVKKNGFSLNPQTQSGTQNSYLMDVHSSEKGWGCTILSIVAVPRIIAILKKYVSHK